MIAATQIPKVIKGWAKKVKKKDRIAPKFVHIRYFFAARYAQVVIMFFLR